MSTLSSLSASSSDSRLGDFIVSDDHVSYESSDSDKSWSPKNKKRKFVSTEAPPKPSIKTHAMVQNLSKTDSQYVVGREREVDQIIQCLRGKTQKPLLIGPVGIGIRSIMKKVASVYSELMGKDHQVICVDCTELLAESLTDNPTEAIGYHLQGSVERNLKRMPHAVIYFRDIEKLLEFDLVKDYIASVFRRPFSFVASISKPMRSEAVEKVQAILHDLNFVSMEIEELKTSDVEKIALRYIESPAISGKVEFKARGITLAVKLADKYDKSRPFPEKAKNLIQACTQRVILNNSRLPKPHNTVVIKEGDFADIISEQTGIPSDDLLNEALFNEDRFKQRLKNFIVGQDHAIETVTSQVANYKMGLTDEKKPWGVFLFVGPTGVGKTELARTLAKLLFHSERNLIIVDGSEFMESYTVSNLIGAPRGYVGHESGGMLTEPLSQNPHQVVLLDEFEKAHEDVRRLFLQVFDRGVLTDRCGKKIDCRETLFIMTSNLGSEELVEAMEDSLMDVDEVKATLEPILLKELSPEFYNRLTAMVPFQPLVKELLPDLVNVKLKEIADSQKRKNDITLLWDQSVVDHFAKDDKDLHLGMRNFCRNIDKTLMGVLKELYQLNEQKISGKMTLSVKEGKFTIKISRNKNCFKTT